MKNYSIQIKDNNTGETTQLEAEGFMLMSVTERDDEGFEASTYADKINATEIAQTFAEFENDHPEVEFLRLLSRKAEELANLGPTPGCDCEVCQEKRKAETGN